MIETTSQIIPQSPRERSSVTIHAALSVRRGVFPRPERAGVRRSRIASEAGVIGNRVLGHQRPRPRLRSIAHGFEKRRAIPYSFNGLTLFGSTNGSEPVTDSRRPWWTYGHRWGDLAARSYSRPLLDLFLFR
jgi:hypothetical protein